MEEVTVETQVRKIPLSFIDDLMKLMENNEETYFRTFMLAIPLQVENCLGESKNYPRKYSDSQVNDVLEECGKGSFGYLITDDWGTSGTPLPQIQHLIGVLDKCGFPEMSESLRKSILDYANLVRQIPIIEGNPNDPPPPTDEIELLHVEFSDICKASIGKARELGRGGFGRVILVPNLHEKLPPKVAVKILTNADGRAQKKFVKELNDLSCVRHENVITLLGFSRGPNWSLIYELAEDGSMKDLLNSRNYAFQDKTKHLKEASVGLHYLHVEKKLMHRDIKTDNILIHKNVAKLCDFGFIKDVESTSDTLLLGTPGYYPPELNKGDVKMMGDIFALGIVVLVLMTDQKAYDESRGENTFLGPLIKMRFEKATDDPLEGLTLARSDPRFDDLRLRLVKYALKCIENEPDDRPKISEVVKELGEIFDCVAKISE